MNRVVNWAIFASLLLSACGPSQAQVQTQVADSIFASQTAASTSTFTATASATATATASDTPTATASMTASATSTSTATATTPPETLTAAAQAYQAAQATLDVVASKTAAAAAMTATREQQIANRTGTAVASGATQTQLATAKTATAAVAAATKTFLSQFSTIDNRELVSYADHHKGEKVQIRIRVFNIVNDHQLQGYFAGTYDAVVIKTADSFTGIYEGTSLTVYGTVGGLTTFSNAYGADISQPLLEDAFFVTPPAPPTATPLPGGAVLIECHPSGGYANVGNVQSFFIESHGGSLEAGNGNTGQYMWSFERAIYYAKDGSGPYVFCTGNSW